MFFRRYDTGIGIVNGVMIDGMVGGKLYPVSLLGFTASLSELK